MSLGYRKLGRNSAQRKALLRDLVTDLIINERKLSFFALLKQFLFSNNWNRREEKRFWLQ